MNRNVILCAAGAASLLSMGVTRQVGLEGRLAMIEEASERSRNDRAQEDLESELRETIDRISRQIMDHGENPEAVQMVSGLQREIEQLETKLTDAQSALAAQGEELKSVEALARKADRLDEVDLRWDGFANALEAQAALVNETREELSGFRAQIDSAGTPLTANAALAEVTASGDPWLDMVAPTVQLAGDATVGSGVLLESQPIPGKPGAYQTLLLTSWHVVRDIRADSIEADAHIPVMLRDENGNKRHMTASLIAHDVPLDAALLVIDSDDAFPFGAKLPTRDRLQSARVFDGIVAVGCPIGNDPIPTIGHVSDLHPKVSSERFWMISAPTYIGNSGGGIYSSKSHELLGIFSKIYTHGSIRPTVIPHMGLVTPLEEFYDWIDGSQSAVVIESGDSATIILQ